MDLGIIVAVSENGAIGKNGKLPWEKIPQDLKHFKSLTIGKPVIMGRKTFESMVPHAPLRDRMNIVVTSQNISGPFYVARTLDEALAMAEKKDYTEAWVIGGRRLYEEALPRANRMELTRVKGNFDGDVYFPDVNWDEWRETKREDYEEFSFLSYVKK